MKARNVIMAGDIGNENRRKEGMARDRHRVYYPKGVSPTIMASQHKNNFGILLINEDKKLCDKDKK